MRSYPAAVAWAERQRQHPSQDWTNLCQKFSRSCVGAGPFGASARLACNLVQDHGKLHRGTPPAGALAFFGSRYSGFGHVIFLVDRGLAYSNDIKRRGKIDVVRWDVFPDAWGMAYRGWTSWTPSGNINLKPVHAPATKPPTKIPAFPGKFGPGAHGAHVSAVQRGLGIKVDGVFGPQTKAAVKAYQLRHKHLWPADGIVGPLTYRALARG